MELKSPLSKEEAAKVLGFNRTFMELKYGLHDYFSHSVPF